MALNLKEPIGPLPLGAWVAVVGGGLGISWYSRRHTTAPAPAVTTAAPVADGAGTFGPGGVGDVTTPPSAAPAPQTNEEWGRLAIETLIGHGFDPITADVSIRNYLNGKYLDSTSKADVDAALRFVGPPPIPVPPMESAPDTPPTQAIPPTAPPGTPSVVDLIAGTGSAHELTFLPGLQTAGVIPDRTIPVYSKAGDPQGLQPVRVIPYGQHPNITGPPVIGPWPGGTATFFPVAGGGFVSAADVAA